MRLASVACFVAREEAERPKRFSYDELLARDKVSLDVVWLREEWLEDLENLQPPYVIAPEIVEDLEAALAELAVVADALGPVARPPIRPVKPASRGADGDAVAGSPTIAHILLDSLRDRLRAERGCTAIELAIRAAVEPGREARAWALVALAARLRADGSRELSRVAIDAAVALDAGPGPTRAAYTCAVALHADEGDLRTAVKLGEELLEEGSNPHLLEAMSRVYWDLWKQTEDAVWLRGWRRVNGLLEGSDVQAA